MARSPRGTGRREPDAQASLPSRSENLPTTEPLREEIEARLGPLVPAGKREQAVEIALSIYAESFSGPIAHPRHLAAYEQILPGSADRIVKMAERQQDHNIEINNKVVNAGIGDERLGMVAGIILLVLFASLAFIAGAVYNNDILAGLFLTATVLDVVGLLLNRARREPKK